MRQPLAEVFGFPISDATAKALRYRKQQLCPFNNKVPNCTKDKAEHPLGVCSILHQDKPVITCPVRFRDEWLIAEKAARFLFGENATWTSLSEIRLLDKNGQSAGNVDYVIVAYDERGRITDFGSLEVQGVYITGNLRNPFDAFMAAPTGNFEWKQGYNYPKPDYLSSSRKRLIPQMLYKGGIFKHWQKRQTVAMQKAFFDTLPALPTVEPEQADIAWFLYDLVPNPLTGAYSLTLVDTVYTEFEAALLRVTTPEPSDIQLFTNLLQTKLDERLEDNPPDAPSLNDVISQ